MQLARVRDGTDNFDTRRLREEGDLWLVEPSTYHSDLLRAKSLATGKERHVMRTLMEFVEDG
jgi:hypothetical protein